MLEKFVLFITLLLFGSCSIGVIGSAIHCLSTGIPTDCPRVIGSDGKCLRGLLGC